MGYANYVGRVGGLAVALGVGVAIATAPGVAWAEPTDSGSTSSSTDSASSSSSTSSSDSSTGSGPDTQSSSSSTSTSTESSQSSASVGDADAGTSGDSTGSPADSGKSEDTGSGSGNKATTKATVKDKKSGSDKSEAGAPKKPKRQAASSPSGADRTDGQSVTDTTTSTQPKAEPVTEAAPTSASVDVAPAPTLGTAPVQDVPEAESAPEPEATPLTSTMLAAVGLAPSAGGDAPDVPMDSPLTLLGLAAFRRQSQQGLVEDEAMTKTASEPAQTSLMMTAAVTTTNSAPIVGPQATGIPDPVTGVVNSTVVASDVDGNTLTYSTTGTSAKGGTVTMNSATGAYTYTPSTAARLAAGTTAAADVDTFTVNVFDGVNTTTGTVSVYVSPTQLATGNPITVGNQPDGIAVYENAADPSTNRTYVINQYDKTVSIIDSNPASSTYNKVVGTIKLASTPSDIVLNSTGTRAYVTTKGNASVAVIDTASKTVLTNVRVGSTPSGIAISPDGTKLYVTNGGSNTVSVVSADTINNKYIEVSRITVGSQPNGIAVSPDGKKLYVTLRYSDSLAVVNLATPTAAPTLIKVGDSPREVVLTPVTGAFAYVTNYDGTVSVVNTSTSQATTITTGGPKLQPAGVAIDAKNGLVYVANGKDTVSVIDTKTNTVLQTITIDSVAESGPHYVALSADGTRIYVTDYNDDVVRTLSLTRGNTAPVATASPTADSTNSSTGAVTGLVNIKDPDGDALTYATLSGATNGTVSYNPSTGTYTYTPTAAARDAAAKGGPTTDTFTIRAIDPAGAYKDTVPITVAIDPKPLAPNQAPYAKATGWGTEGDLNTGVIKGQMNGVDADGDPLTYAVWSPSRSGTVTVNPTTGEFTYVPTLSARLKADTTNGADIDFISISVSDGRATTNYSMPVYVAPARLSVAAPTSIGQDPTGVAVGGDKVFVLNQADKTMSVIGANGNSTISFSSTPTAVAVSQDGSRAYVTLSGTTGSVAVIDTATKQIVKTIGVGSSPAGIALSQDGNRLYVTNSGGGSVSVIDTNPASATYNTELRRITVGSQATGIAVTPDGRRLYVTRPGTGVVAVVDTVTNATTNVTVGGSPKGVAVTPDGRSVYVTNDDGTVSVIDTATNYVVNRITVGPSPLGVSIGRDGTAFVANGNDTVSLIDTGKQSVFATIALSSQTASGPHYVAVNADATRIYVTDTNDDTLRGLTVTRGNTAPEFNLYTPVTLGATNQSNGAVAGAVNTLDWDRDVLSYTASAPANGTVTIDPATGNFTYTPSQAARDFALTTEANEVDTFTITVSDGQTTATTGVTVPVAATNNVAPEWQDQTFTYDPATGSTTGAVIARDADGDALRYYIVGSPGYGSATVNEDGTYVYTPFMTSGYQNYDYIPIAITDGHYTTYTYIWALTYTEYCGEACAW